MNRALLTLVLIAGVLGPAGTAAADHDPRTYSRLYLLADGGEHLWWSFDQREPAATLRTVVRRCPDVPRLPGMAPCRGALGVNGRPVTIWFTPRSLFAQEVEWTSASPVRFRLALEVETASPYTVELGWGTQGAAAAFEPATQVAPGVWEGKVTKRTSISPDGQPEIGIRVNLQPDGVATMRVRTDGSSYLEFPTPFGGWSHEELQRRSPEPTMPQSFESPLRSFTFNDSDWEVFSYQGTLDQVRSYAVTLDDGAAWVIGWAEMYAEPWVHQLVREGRLPPERLTDTPRVRLFLDGALLSYGYNLEDEQTGRGTDMSSALNVGPGVVRMDVTPSDFAQGGSYRAYLLVGHGPRTLRSMRTRFTPNHFYFLPVGGAGGVSVCPGNAESIPLTAEATTATIDLDWDSVNPTTYWSLRYTLPGGADMPCGWGGPGAEKAFVLRNYVMGFGATPGYDTATVVYRDTVIDAQARIWYTPLPHPD